MRVFENYKELAEAMNNGTFLFKPEYGPASFICSHCGKPHALNTDGLGGTGYAIGSNDEFICYPCCGEIDADQLKNDGKGYMYFCGDKVTNWPGTLSFSILSRSYSFHNFAGKNGRVDFWFKAFGANWHGVCIGRDNQVSRVRRLKGA